MRPHADLIKKWADNENSEVWFYDKKYQNWTTTEKPEWQPVLKYVVVIPEYKEAWQAYLDGELQFYLFGYWTDWDTGIPTFNTPPTDYRRKPKVPETPQVGEKWKHICGVVVVVTGETSGVVISQGDSCNKLYDYAETWNWNVCPKSWSKVS